MSAGAARETGCCRQRSALFALLCVLFAWQFPGAAGQTSGENSGLFSDRRNDMTLSNTEKCGAYGAAAGNKKESIKYIGTNITASRCGVPIGTNCSISYQAMTCPEECPYVAPSGKFACLFLCVAAPNCSVGNPNRAFPNPNSKTCMPCALLGCRQCSSDGMSCVRCHDAFDMVDKKCIIYYDHRGYFQHFARVLGAIIGTLVVIGTLWTQLKPKSEHFDRNLFSVLRARRHRHLAKALQWELHNMKQVVSRYNLFMDVHCKNILGLGIALFYNAVVFIGVCAVICWVIMSWVHADLDLTEWVPTPNAGPQMTHGVLLEASPPAILSSRLAPCGRLYDFGRMLDDFAHRKFLGIGALYVIFFAACLLFCLFQKRHGKWFRAHNVIMADYALQVSGLPKDATDEPEIWKHLETELRKLVPDVHKRPHKVQDMGKHGDFTVPRQSSQIELLGVSLCYSYNDNWGLVDEIVQGMQMRMELECALQRRDADIKEKEHPHKAHKLLSVIDKPSLDKEIGHHQEKVASFFEGDNKLETNGNAFMVFRWAQDMEKVWKAYTDGGCKPLDYKGHPVTLNWVHNEPTSINWWHLGRPWTMSNLLQGLLQIAIIVAVVVGLVIYPYFAYILLPNAMIGSAAGGLAQTIMGAVVGQLNCMVMIRIWMIGFGIGFHTRDEMDVMQLICNTLLFIINNGFVVFACYYQAYHSEVHSSGLHDMFSSQVQPASVGIENNFAQNLYNMMTPGFFYVGKIMLIFNAGVVPVFFNTLMMKVVYVWACFPRCVLKVLRIIVPWSTSDIDDFPYWRAERALEPMEIQIGDYADLLIVPSMCMIPLFLSTPYSTTLFREMILWSVFFYCFLRYWHLRGCKKCYYTTNFVDNCYQMLLAFPLSLIAAAWFQWGFRAEVFCAGLLSLPDQVKLFLTFVVFFASCALWLGVWHRFVQAWEPQKDWADADKHPHNGLEFVECKEKLVYSWFNCNPVFVLKCAYFWHDKNDNLLEERQRQHPIACGEDAGKVRFFQVGKEYLFINWKRQHLAFPDPDFPGDAWELETYIEIFLNFWGKLTHCDYFKKGDGKVEPASEIKKNDTEQTGLIQSQLEEALVAADDHLDSR